MASYSSQLLTTSLVEQRETADYWVDLICETFVKLTAQQVDRAGFRGEIRWEALGELEFSTVTASGQDVYRSKEFISSASNEYLLFSIQRRGEGVVVQDGKTARLNPGGMALYDSSRPYSLHFPGPFQQLVVQIPKAVVGIEDTQRITAVPHRAGTPEAVIAPLLVSMNEQLQQGGNALEPLKDHVLGALSEIVSQSPKDVDQILPDAFIRSRVLEQMRHDLSDPKWTVERLAIRCHMSLRTLYRLFPEKGIAAVMRTMRLNEAKRLLRKDLGVPLAALAHRCGFASESGFIRAFRSTTGMTPLDYAKSSRRNR